MIALGSGREGSKFCVEGWTKGSRGSKNENAPPPLSLAKERGEGGSAVFCMTLLRVTLQDP